MVNESYYGLIRFGAAGMEPLHKAQDFKELPVQEREMRTALFTGLADSKEAYCLSWSLLSHM